MSRQPAWKQHVYRVGTAFDSWDEPPPEVDVIRRQIEPWLSAVFQSEHLSLLVGSGLTSAIASLAGTQAAGMATIKLESDFADRVMVHAGQTAKFTGRGEPNIEDEIKSAAALIAGLEVLGDRDGSEKLRLALNDVLTRFLGSILETEGAIRTVLESDAGAEARSYLISFLLSFASRAASRERLHVFTTNYDRLLEYGADLVGLRVVDRFVGALTPVFRSSRLDVDLHYNPPGIRGEPRYLEGVIRLSKLHGSIDWRFEAGLVRRYTIPFGADLKHPDIPTAPINSVMIYPNAAKDVQTLEYPYAELFRDFSAATSRPNSVLVTYGYGFGDDHINRIIEDMLTVPSTHLVIISHSTASGRIPGFCARIGREAQVSLLIGPHFGDLRSLVDHYLPKAAIDQITWKREELLRRRGEAYRFAAAAEPAAEPAEEGPQR